MIIFGFYLMILTTFILLLIEITVRVIEYKGKRINLDFKAYDALLKMLNLHGADLKSEKFKIVESKRHLFDFFENIIGIRNFELKTVFDHIGSLHEGGHYLSINQNAQRRKRFMLSSIIIVLNRLIVIPLFFLTAYYFGIVKGQPPTNLTFLTVALFFFIIASVLRLSFGMSEEYRASRIAYEHLKQHYDESVIKYAKRFLVASFFNHLFLALMLIIAIPLIYSMLIFAL